MKTCGYSNWCAIFWRTRAGEIDERFLNEIAPLKHSFENLQLRQTLQLDGLIVRDLSVAVMTRGRELATCVDNSLQNATKDSSELGHLTNSNAHKYLLQRFTAHMATH